MKDLGYDVIPVFFQTPFFGPENARKVVEQIGMKLIVEDITEEHLIMLKHPRYGFGKNLNPCIDCHGLMFRRAGELLEKYQADFIISGEVVGQRPMSQRRDAINSVGKLSQVKDLLIRPLSQKLLTDTLPIREGWVRKEEMLDIQGRSRSRQRAMAEDYGITWYQNPGGGCLLTDVSYSRRLKDLMDNEMMTLEFVRFLKTGRHFRISEDVKLIVGRNNEDNEELSRLTKDNLVLKTVVVPGPLGIVNSKRELAIEELTLAASILLRYHNKVTGEGDVCYGPNFHLDSTVQVEKATDKELEKYRI